MTIEIKMVGHNEIDGSIYVWASGTPHIVEHVASLIAGRENEIYAREDGTRGELITEARTLATGPEHDKYASQGGVSAGGGGDNWRRARWLARWAMSGIETTDEVVVALRRMDD